jgi:dTDP-4-amino-4,6-dideoxygalactose transaminase
MVEIGERPILWHIMKIHSHHGPDHFVTCLGYNLKAAHMQAAIGCAQLARLDDFFAARKRDPGRLQLDAAWPAIETLHDLVFCVKSLPKMLAALTAQLHERGVTPAAIRTDAWQ